MSGSAPKARRRGSAIRWRSAGTAGPFEEFWARFRRNRLAVAGLAVVLVYTAVAVLADGLYSYDFITGNQIPNAFAPVGTAAKVEWAGKRKQPPVPAAAPTTSAATCWAASCTGRGFR